MPEISFKMGGFARARMAGDKNHLTFVNLETDIFQGFETAGIGFGNLFETDHGFS